MTVLSPVYLMLRFVRMAALPQYFSSRLNADFRRGESLTWRTVPEIAYGLPFALCGGLHIVPHLIMHATMVKLWPAVFQQRTDPLFGRFLRYKNYYCKS